MESYAFISQRDKMESKKVVWARPTASWTPFTLHRPLRPFHYRNYSFSMWNDQSSGCSIVLVSRCVTWTQEIKVCKRCVSDSWSPLGVQRTNSCVASSSSQLWRLLAPGNVGVSQALPPVFRARGLLPSVYCLDPSQDLTKLLTKQNSVPRYQAVYCLPLFCVSFSWWMLHLVLPSSVLLYCNTCVHTNTHAKGIYQLFPSFPRNSRKSVAQQIKEKLSLMTQGS